MPSIEIALTLLVSSPLASVPLATPSDVSFTYDPEVASLEMRPVEIELLGGGTVTVQRGELSVPIVRTDPKSKEITIDVWLFPRTPEADPDTPPIVRLHGGPGWPGFEPRPGEYENGILPLLRLSDLIIVGQRGIGTSKPDTACAGVASPAGPDDADDTDDAERAELTRAEADAALQDACRACRKHWEEAGYDLRGLNVIEAAADVDDVRRLLGYDQVQLWGGSFGSHWGMTILRYFPHSVARAILTGMEGPDHTYDMPSGVLASLKRMAAEAESSPVLEGRIPEGGLIAALEDVIARFEDEPIVVEIGEASVRLDADDIRSVALGYSARVSSRRAMPTWPADILALYEGKYDQLAWMKHSRGNEDGSLPTASFFMLDCGSGISPARLETLQHDPAAAIVGDLGHWYQTACAVWGSDLGDAFRGEFTTKVPTVVVHGTYDTSTPFDNALELLPSFEELQFVVVEGGSHSALDEAMRESPAFRSALESFIATGDMSELPDEVRMPPIAWEAPR